MLANALGTLCAGLCAVLLAFFGAARAFAQPEPTYETARLTSYLEQRGLRPDPRPEGKTIAYVRYARRPVLEGDDLLVPIVLPRGASTWPNYFHYLTEQSTIERELLFWEGEPFREARAEESMRNLRALGIFSLVRIVAVETSRPGEVGVLVYTRDLWSLRLEQQFAGVDGNFTLGAQLVERNFLGRNKTLAARVFVDAFTFSVGQSYLDPRVLSGELRLQESFDLIVNRETQHVEGSTGQLSIGRPFYNLSQRFAFDLSGRYADYVYRDETNGELAGFDLRPGASFGAACAVGSADCVGRVWDDAWFVVEGGAAYRIGQHYKQTFRAGAGARDRSVHANDETALEPGQRTAFARYVLPRVRTDVYPFVGYRLELPTFTVFENLATFGQSENVRTGPLCEARFAWPLEALGSTRNAWVPQGTIGYVLAQHDMLVDVLIEATARLDGGAVIDQHAFVRLRGASPSFDAILGRAVLNAVWDVRQDDSQRTLVSLGGDTGLRGFPNQAFYTYGGSRFLANFEYRSRPWLLQSVHLGVVAFYDVGAVYQRVANVQVHHDVGAGLRVLFPHFNRYVFRIDVGVPLDEEGYSVVIGYSSEQGVLLTEAEDQLSTTAISPRPR